MKKVLIEVKGLSKYFPVTKTENLKALDNITFNIYENEILGIVGESGCGKSTLGRTILALHSATAGEVIFAGLDVHQAKKSEKKAFKKRAQIILQDPYASLNPRMTVADLVGEGMLAHKLYPNKEEREKRVLELLQLVGLNQEHMSRYPHEFSGGQRQRIGIARTLAVEPDFIVCDEPISALDVSIQAQIINLFIRLKKDLGLTYLFIAHDLSMVRHISDRVGVMYLGNLVELTTSEELYRRPLHPYTQALMSAIPSIDVNNPVSKRRIRMPGEVTSPINPQPLCRFLDRCHKAKDICYQKEPKFEEVEDNHYLACLAYEN